MIRDVTWKTSILWLSDLWTHTVASHAILAFSTNPKKQIPWNFWNQTLYPRRLSSPLADSGSFSHSAPVAWALISFFDQRPLWQKRQRRGWRRGRGKRKDPYRMLSTGQWIFSTIQMYLQNAWVIHYSRFWSVTKDPRNEWWYLFADFISLILLIPLACVPLLIRKWGFPLINWWVSCCALSQISCPHYLSFQPMTASERMCSARLQS